MTDEQFDELCRSALAYDANRASETTWSRIRPPRWSWLPTVPEIFACGSLCALALGGVGVRFVRVPRADVRPNPVIEMAMAKSPIGWQASNLSGLDLAPAMAQLNELKPFGAVQARKREVKDVPGERGID